MSRFFGVYILFLCGATTVGGFAQTVPTQPAVGEEIRRRNNDNRFRQISEERRGAAEPVFVRRGALSFRKNISRKQKKVLAPDAADLNRYAAFLQNENAGLIKLFPDQGCEDNARVVRVDETCLNQIPMSSFYSFREQEHTTDYLADLRLKRDILISDGLLSQGILVALGDKSLESVSPNSEGLKYLNEYQPEINSNAALEQTRQLIRGIAADGFYYQKALPARENMTYALRVVAYRGKIIQTIRGFPWNMLEGDDRVDLTIAFRLLKKDEMSGHYTILWKELSKRESPKIVYPKRDKQRTYQRIK